MYYFPSFESTTITTIIQSNMQIDSKVVEGLFPKYRGLFEKEVERPNEQLEYFIK